MESADPLAALERWVDHGAEYRVVELSADQVVLELLTCYGEPVDRLDSRDRDLLTYVRQRVGEPGAVSTS
jgi:hypothetical protein